MILVPGPQTRFRSGPASGQPDSFSEAGRYPARKSDSPAAFLVEAKRARDSLIASSSQQTETNQNAPAAISESSRGTVGSADGLESNSPQNKTALPGLTLPANHQTKQRYNTGQGLTLRAKLSTDINE